MEWPYSTDSLHVQQSGGTVCLLRHEAEPFVGSGPKRETLLFETAQAYVEKWGAKLGLSVTQVQQLKTSLDDALASRRPAAAPSDGRLAWLAFSGLHPGGSFFVDRHDGSDRSAILLAGLWMPDGDGVKLVPQQALRVVAHVDGAEGDWMVRITGITLSLARSPSAPARNWLGWPPAPSKAVGRSGPEEGAARRLVLRDPITRFGVAARARFAPPIRDPGTAVAALEQSTVGVVATDGTLRLERTGLFTVLASDGDMQGVDPEVDAAQILTEPDSSNDLGSPEVWAASAFFHANSLFERLLEWGFDEKALLRFIELPLLVRYLATVNGDHGNAQARWRNDDPLAEPSLRRRKLELRFGYVAQGGMSLCCDPRWQWHEFGHVALGGTTGNGELPFAHSIGDALSAVLHDPNSRLAEGDASERGRSFPWVCTDSKTPYRGEFARFHDRRVEAGWGWQGIRVRGSNDDQQHLYRAEQVLSSTLFLLYRTLGGDCIDREGRIDADSRAAASDHVLYLVFRALALLGPSALVEASDADHLVSALIDADAGTRSFHSRYGGDAPRSGGSARKPIRWAFEHMGLYATPGAAADRCGAPPQVDLYIDDGRSGEYTPIDLNGKAWYAARHAVHVELAATAGASRRKANLAVAIANRGLNASPTATLRLWTAEIDGKGPPSWPGAAWEEHGPVSVPSVPSGRMVGVDTTLEIGKRETAVLLAVSCLDDRANTDPETRLPCTSTSAPQPVNYLVANDNNLAFVIV